MSCLCPYSLCEWCILSLMGVLINIPNDLALSMVLTLVVRRVRSEFNCINWKIPWNSYKENIHTHVTIFKQRKSHRLTWYKVHYSSLFCSAAQRKLENTFLPKICTGKAWTHHIQLALEKWSFALSNDVSPDPEAIICRVPMWLKLDTPQIQVLCAMVARNWPHTFWPPPDTGQVKYHHILFQ